MTLTLIALFFLATIVFLTNLGIVITSGIAGLVILLSATAVYIASPRRD